MPGDVSDLDAIRVGDDYLCHLVHHALLAWSVILHSKELVNWTVLGHVVQDLKVLDPEWD